MARINYDDQTAAAFRTVREVPRDGLGEWRDAIQRHLSPSPGMTLADIGAGTGAFAAAFRDWFGLSVLAVEPSAAMRAQIPCRPGIGVFEGFRRTNLPGVRRRRIPPARTRASPSERADQPPNSSPAQTSSATPIQRCAI